MRMKATKGRGQVLSVTSGGDDRGDARVRCRRLAPALGGIF